MYASPKALVTAAAVVAEIAPPTTDPTPGMSFSSPPTIARPVKVAAVPPTVLATSVLRNPSENDNPYVDVIPATIAICIGTSNAASANGKGDAPIPAADDAVVPTIRWERCRLRAKSAF